MEPKTLSIPILSMLIVLVPSYAYASVDGTTYDSSSNKLFDTKVTAEIENFYDWTRSSSSDASYSLDLSSDETYLMAAMKTDYNYVSDWNVSPPTTKDWFLGSRDIPLEDAKYLIVTDQDFRNDHSSNHETVAEDITLDAAEPWFHEEHGILLEKAGYEEYTRSTTNCSNIGWDVHNSYSIGEMVIVVIGKDVDLVNDDGDSVLGCALEPDSGGSYAWAVVKEITSDPARLSMHEISHNYGFDHVRDGYGDTSTDFKTVMHKFFDDPMQIKNWSPPEDDTLEDRRSWYPE